jgi:hypothetical protein
MSTVDDADQFVPPAIKVILVPGLTAVEGLVQVIYPSVVCNAEPVQALSVIVNTVFGAIEFNVTSLSVSLLVVTFNIAKSPALCAFPQLANPIRKIHKNKSFSCRFMFTIVSFWILKSLSFLKISNIKGYDDIGILTATRQ